MALSTTFGPLTAATGAELDTNFAQVGALTTIQCSATGTNSIVLTPAANQPSVGGYGLPNPVKFGFSAPATTTGSVTLQIGSLGFLPVYTPNGSQATSGTMASGNYYEVTYTTGSIYNSGNGAWVLSSFQPAAGSTVLAGSLVRGLKIKNNSGTPSTQIDISFQQACLVTASGVPTFVVNGSATIDLTTGTVTSAANGMDGESRPASGWIYIYAISTGSGAAGLATNNVPLSTGPTLPAGYSYYAYLGAMYCDGSSNLLRSQQLGQTAQYTAVASSNTAVPPIIASGATGTSTLSSPTLVAVGVGSVVPPTAATITVMASASWKGGSLINNIVAPSAAYSGSNNGPQGSNGFVYPIAIVGQTSTSLISDTATMVLESANIYWAAGTAGAIACLGWTDYVSAAA